MAKIHHKTLQAAVAIYLPLLLSGKTADETKAAISMDEKGYDEEAINEIFDAVLLQSESDGANKVYLVVSPFRDIEDFSLQYNVGDDVSHFDNARIEKLLSQDLIVAL